MAEFRRPAFADAHVVKLTEHLRAAGIVSSIRFQRGEAAYITADATAPAIDAALATYVDDPDWAPPLPGDLPTHVAHLAQFLAASPAQLAALTQAQRDHALQDVIRALKALVDGRLG